MAEIIFSVMETVFPVVETTGSATLTVVSFQQAVVPGTMRVPRASPGYFRGQD
jgi:hypothetical protein